MYSNSRQKKRSSQFRKKYHDSRGKGKEGETAKQPQKQQKKQPETVKDEASRTDETSDAAEVSHVGTSRDDEEVKHEHRKYSRRKVISNWDRYGDVGAEDGEGGYQESEEELQQRLVQLLNLPSAPPSEMPLTENAYQPSHSDKNSFLSLDCGALAEAMSSLPLHKRLDISLELLELATDPSPRHPEAGLLEVATDPSPRHSEADSSPRHSEADSSPRHSEADSSPRHPEADSSPRHPETDPSPRHPEADPSPRHSEAGSVDLAAACNSKSLRKTADKFFFQVPAAEASRTAAGTSSLHKSTDVSVNTSEKGTTLPDSRVCGVQDSDHVADRDKELDKLLTAETLPERTSRGYGEDLGAVTSHATPHSGEVSDSSPVADPNTAELDDMLDELLA